MKILPIAVLYGANASGKTNFFNALNFAKYLIVRGSQPDSLIPVEPFQLNANCTKQPSRFSFELLIDETVYEFSFAVTSKSIIEEKLVRITSSTEKVLYHRQKDKLQHLDTSLSDEEFLQFTFKGTRDNQLFLTNAVSQKIDSFKPIYNWFKYNLELVGPDSRFYPFEQLTFDDTPLSATMNHILHQLDTGITELHYEQIPFENINLPSIIKMRLQEDIKEGMTARTFIDPQHTRYVITRNNGKLVAKKLMTYHMGSDGTKAMFEFYQESDGTQRVIDLLPAFLDLTYNNSKSVYVIDEIDRSLHTLLIRTLIEGYLGTCSSDSRTQLLLTSHDVFLMDKEVLRLDEMWVTERDEHEVSRLLSFSEYKDARKDKNIRKSYLQGRLGGIPKILLGDTLFSQNSTIISEDGK